MTDAMADQLRAALAATPEPVTGATQDEDPRIDAVAEFVRQQFGSRSDSPVALAGHRLLARRFIATADAADAAAGIRRVPADEEISPNVWRLRRELRLIRQMVADYDGTPLCPSCGNGYPICTDGFTHDETCARYVWSDNTCGDCDAQMSAEFEERTEPQEALAESNPGVKFTILAVEQDVQPEPEFLEQACEVYFTAMRAALGEPPHPWRRWANEGQLTKAVHRSAMTELWEWMTNGG